MIRIMGNFDIPAKKPQKQKRCWNCDRPVSVTVGDFGLCKKCIKKAQKGG